MTSEMQDYMSAADGTRLWYEVIGQGPVTLVLCDGVGCAGYIWKYIVADFSSQYRILHGQYRAHGHSDVPKDLSTMTVEQLADDMNSLIEKVVGNGPIVLMGHSMGVQVALECYRRRPASVRSLVLINGPYGKALQHVHSTKFFVNILPTVRSLVDRWQGLVNRYWEPVLDSELSYIIAMIFEVNPLLTKRKDFRPYFKELGSINPQAFFTALNNANKHSAYTVLRHIKIPCLVVAGDRDRFTPYPIVRKMFEAIPKAEYLMLRKGSHIGPLELPRILNQRIDAFLRSQLEPET